VRSSEPTKAGPGRAVALNTLLVAPVHASTVEVPPSHVNEVPVHDSVAVLYDRRVCAKSVPSALAWYDGRPLRRGFTVSMT